MGFLGISVFMFVMFVIFIETYEKLMSHNWKTPKNSFPWEIPITDGTVADIEITDSRLETYNNINFYDGRLVW